MRSFTRLTAIPILATLVLAGCGQAAPPAASSSAGSASAAAQTAKQSSPEVERLLAAAKAAGETELDLSGTDTLDIKGFDALFNRMYGTNIKVKFTPFSSMTAMATKVGQEVAAGQTSSTDVLVGAESTLSAIYDRNVLEAYDYTTLSPRIDKKLMLPNQTAVEFSSRFPSISYNNTRLKEADAPKKLTDLADPKWKGKVAVKSDELATAALLPNWGVDAMKAFAVKMAQNDTGLLNCGDHARVVTGEFLMFLDCGSYSAQQLAKNGAPLATVIPEDAPLASFWYLGVPRTSAHPNLGKLWISMVLSEEGQRIFFAAYGTDDYDLPGSQSVAELAQLKAKGIEPLRVDAIFLKDHPEHPRISSEIEQILRVGAKS